jgi:hypothetical protein
MRFEDLDKKIKEAADQHHPAYDEKAWQKMEKLLEEHLPQPTKDRRRIIFFLLLALLIGGGTFMIVSKPWEKNSKTAYEPVRENKNGNQPGQQSKDAGTSIESKTGTTDGKEIVKENNSDIRPNSEINNINPRDKNVIASSPKNISTNQSQLVKRQKKITNNSTSVLSNDNKRTDLPVAKESQNPTADNSNQPVSKPNKEAADITKTTKSESNKDQGKLTNLNANQEVAKTETKEIAKTETTKATAKKNGIPLNRNGFSFSVSAGPDISKAGSSKTGKTVLAYGAGVGYTRNRFTLRAGVYAAKKIYWAGPTDYKLSYTPPPTVKFEGADADCYVMEIPVKLSYNFGFRNKSHWFAGAGLASYLMKREDYVYTYKPVAGGQPYYHPYSVKNENKHYFSVLNLSGGYTRQLNNTFSISAEPYVEIPLTGIGAGKVHLNSGGVLFTFGVKPFKK